MKKKSSYCPFCGTDLCLLVYPKDKVYAAMKEANMRERKFRLMASAWARLSKGR